MSPLVFLGPPASGKGTQAQRLSESLGFAYLSTGAMLRRAMKDRSDLGLAAKPFLDLGEYVPDEIMVPIVLDWIIGKGGQWILDGFPRTVAQAEALDAALAVSDRVLPIALALEVPDEELRRRVNARLECESCHFTTSQPGPCPKCGGVLAPRDDDDSRFESRLAEYQRLVVPTVNYFEEVSRVIKINGQGSPDEVAQRVCERIINVN